MFELKPSIGTIPIPIGAQIGCATALVMRRPALSDGYCVNESKQRQSVFDYVRTLHDTDEYKAFDPDDSLHLAKDTQFAYHVVASTTDAQMFSAWAPSLLASGHPTLLEAIARNPVASSSHLQVLLANTRVSEAILMHVAKHANATPGLINKILFTLDGGHSPALYLTLVARRDLTPDHVTALMYKRISEVNAVLALNPCVPEAQRVLAALAV